LGAPYNCAAFPCTKSTGSITYSYSSWRTSANINLAAGTYRAIYFGQSMPDVGDNTTIFGFELRLGGTVIPDSRFLFSQQNTCYGQTIFTITSSLTLTLNMRHNRGIPLSFNSPFLSSSKWNNGTLCCIYIERIA
jgi:hypothetical protein